MRLIPLALAMWLFAATASAQSTATLQGMVTDAQKAAVPGVAVTIRNEATGAERAAVTDSVGRYVAASLPPGRYTVVAHVDGFQDQRRELELGVAETVALDLQMNVSGVSEDVTVVAGSPVIELSTVSVGQVMAERTVQEIPLNGRHFVDLGPLMPGGVTPTKK